MVLLDFVYESLHTDRAPLKPLELLGPVLEGPHLLRLWHGERLPRVQHGARTAGVGRVSLGLEAGFQVKRYPDFTGFQNTRQIRHLKNKKKHKINKI